MALMPFTYGAFLLRPQHHLYRRTTVSVALENLQLSFHAQEEKSDVLSRGDVDIPT